MASLTRDQVIAALVARGADLDRAVLYCDAFEEYRKAQDNIREYGPLIQDPRNGRWVVNPYVPLRDRARKALDHMRDVDAAFLWVDGGAVDGGG